MTGDGAGWQPLAGSAQSVVLEVLVHGPLPRTEIARRLGLSVPSLSRITKPLIDAGVLIERAGVQSETLGRPAIPLDVVPSSRHFIGIKLTADALFVVVTDLRGTIVAEFASPLPATDLTSVVDQIAATVAELRRAHPTVHGLGISLGGHTIDRRHVAHAPFLGWRDVPLASLLTDATGLPSWVENDVRALAQAEHWFGAGRGRTSFALLTVGAGIGLGIVANDAIIPGANSAAGSIGHQRVGSSGAVCELGHRGCARALLSIPAVLGAAALALGPQTDFETVLESARSGHPAARRIVDDAAHALGILVADVVNVLDPAVVLLSGEGVGVASVGREAFDASLASAKHWAVPTPAVEVLPFRFNEWARGAAAVAIQMSTIAR